MRSQSRSAALLGAAKALAPAGVDFHVFDRHGELPLFNPDIEAALPEPAMALRDAVAAADAIVIVSPEYAHGISGNMKNTLDWLVGHPPFVFKPVAVFNPAADAHHADESLKEILRTMSADLMGDACVRIPVIGAGITSAADVVASPMLKAALVSAWQAVVCHVEGIRARGEAAVRVVFDR